MSAALLASRRRSKYNAKPTRLDGERFDSQGEARRWAELKLLERAGEIRDLQRQSPYPLMVNGVDVATYVADFVYLERRQTSSFTGEDRGAGPYEWEAVVEDFKGHRLPIYQLKKKLMKAIYGIEIRETGGRPLTRRHRGRKMPKTQGDTA